jgi:flagellar hook-length control protein FliK
MMRLSVPSVASEVQTTLTCARPPSSRSPADAEARQPDTPFADLLDSAAASAEPLPRPQVTRPDQAGASKLSRDRSADAVPARSGANSNDDRGANGATDPKTESDARDIVVAATDGEVCKADAGKPVAAGDTTEQDADVTWAPEAMFVDPAPPATAPQAPLVTAVTLPTLSAATAQDGEPEQQDLGTEALPAVPATGENVNGGRPAAPSQAGRRPAATPVTVLQLGPTKASAQTTANGQSDDHAPPTGTPATNAKTIDPRIVSQLEAGRDGQTHAKDQTAANDTHRTFADLLGKTATDAVLQAPGNGGTTVKAGSDPVQNFLMTTSGSAGNAPAATTPANAAVQIQAPAVPLAGLAIEIAKEATAGKHQFEIRLDPPELGRIDVRLSVDHDGRVTSHLVADRADTLDLLKRDAAQLERALQQAGLKTSDNALEFSLRQQGFAGDDTPAPNAAQLIVPDDDPAPLEALRQGYGRLLGLGGGLDIRV